MICARCTCHGGRARDSLSRARRRGVLLSLTRRGSRRSLRGAIDSIVGSARKDPLASLRATAIKGVLETGGPRIRSNFERDTALPPVTRGDRCAGGEAKGARPSTLRGRVGLFVRAGDYLRAHAGQVVVG